MQPDRKISFERIRERAYELWERNHRPEGFEIEFWLLAEREIRSERRDEAAAAGQPSSPDRETDALTRSGSPVATAPGGGRHVPQNVR